MELRFPLILDGATGTELQKRGYTGDVSAEQWVLAHPDSILAQVVAENDGRVSGQSAFIAARQGDPVGQRICEEYVSYLSCGIVNMVNVFQPDTLAIGGGVSNEADEQLLLPVQRCVERESIPCGKNRRTRIVKAELGNQAGIIGAAGVHHGNGLRQSIMGQMVIGDDQVHPQ